MIIVVNMVIELSWNIKKLLHVATGKIVVHSIKVGWV